MVNILTSSFFNGFPADFGSQLSKYIKPGMNFVFIASEFMNIDERTDWYCNYFLKMFSECGIHFETIHIIDGRISMKMAQDLVRKADVIWLAGGDTPTQFHYLQAYGLISLIRNHEGVTIGMSAGSINMCKTALCTLTCKHAEQSIYEGLGLVEFSVEPHFDIEHVTEELLELSERYVIYGICDESAIISTNDSLLFIGEIYQVSNRNTVHVENV